MPDEYYNSIYTGEEIDRRLGLAGETASAVFFDANSESQWAVGAISSSSGANSTSTTRLRTTGYIGAGVKKIAVASGYKYILFGYSSGVYMGTWNGTSFVKSGNWRTTETDLTALPDYNFRLVMAYIGDGAITTTAASNITLSASTDTSLSVSGAAAEAKAVGDALSIRPQVTEFFGGAVLGNQPANTICRVVNANVDFTDEPEGVDLSSNAGWLYTFGNSNMHQILFYPHLNTYYQRMYRKLGSTWSWTAWSYGEQPAIDAVAALKSELCITESYDFAGDQLYGYYIPASNVWRDHDIAKCSIVKIPDDCISLTVQSSPDIALIIAFFSGQPYPWDGLYPEYSQNYPARISIPAGNSATYQVESDMKFMYVGRISVGGADINPQLSFECFRPAEPKAPLYVAFGASTTVGAVHHLSGEGGITYTDKNYPALVGQALGYRAVNLGHGSTGFLKRASSPNNLNIMDAIYGADTYLQNAALVSIVFGYGNDGSAGGTGGTGLPIGSWDDYYPYDEEGYHPSGEEGEATMLSKGCTLFGCLNWCIKWLNEKYPKAQLVVIFGAPSANRYRKIDLLPQTEGAGVAPYKLSYTDPYGSVATGNNAKLMQISEQLKLLKEVLNIPIIDTFFDAGIPFSFYSTYAKKSDGTYAIFSSEGSAESPVWNSHPNEEGYRIWGQYISGLIVSQVCK